METEEKINVVKKDIKTLMKVINTNQEIIGNLLTRVEYLEKKEEVEKKTSSSNMYQ